MYYYYLFGIVIIIVVLFFVFKKSNKKSVNTNSEQISEQKYIVKESFNKTVVNKPEIKNNKKIEILVLVTRSCPACKHYDSQLHDKIIEFCKNNGYEYKRVYQDDDKDHLFDKYKVEYIPCCFIIVNGKATKLNGNITPDNIKSQIKNI